MSDLYPFTSRYLDLNGHQLHYLDEGFGDPVLMLHGNPTWSFYYRSLVSGLRETHRVLVPDHIGCGLSNKPSNAHYRYTLEQRVNDIENFLGQIDIRSRFDLVVHDWGGMIGMVYALRHRERIRRLVILNTAAFRIPSTKKLPWSLWLARNTTVGKYLVLYLNAFCRGALRYCTVTPLESEVREEYLRPYDSAEKRVAILEFVRDIPLNPSDPSYQLVYEVEQNFDKFQDLPTLICWGKQDFVFDDCFLAVWKEKMPHAEVHEFADGGHYVLEDKRDEIVTLVKEFYTRSGER